MVATFPLFNKGQVDCNNNSDYRALGRIETKEGKVVMVVIVATARTYIAVMAPVDVSASAVC